MAKAVTCLLINKDGKLLILKRSRMVKTYKGLWGGVAGYIEENEKPYETALKEIREEVGIEKKNISLIREVEPVEFTDFHEGWKYDWVIHPFLFKVKSVGQIKIDWEHSEYRWINPLEIKNFDTVPYFKEIVSEILL
jgi:8-oxo-dGTP pyrophosphatase MutT (NUDIX family)